VTGVLRYPGPAGEAVARLLGVEDSILGLARRETDHRQQAVFLAYAHERRQLPVDVVGLDVPVLGDVGQMVAVAWAVKDVLRVEVSSDVNPYDILADGVRLGLRGVVEVIDLDPDDVSPGRVFSVVASSPGPTLLKRPSFHGQILVYGQRWVLRDG
jgi:hypothetical protein